MSEIFNLLLLQNTLRTATPVVLCALGCLMTDQVGIMNIGVDGMMLMGAFFAVLGSYLFGSWAMGLVFATVLGVLLGLFYYVFSVKFKSDEFIIGVALNILAGGLTVFLLRTLFGVKGSFSGPGIVLSDINISYPAMLTIVVAMISMAILTILVRKTKMGKAMRAVSEDMGAAQLMGISVNGTISFTFAIGSALAGIGAVLYCTAYPQASPTMGAMLGLKAFVAAVLGGIGSIPGAMIGGFAIGLAEALVSSVGLSVWKDGVVFAILIVVLLVKPTGIMGRVINEKV